MKWISLGQKADYFGITGSVLCIIHCLLTPILAMSSTFIRHDALWTGYLSMDYVFIGINVLAVFSATRHETTKGIKIALWSFLSLFATALLLEEVNEIFEYVAYAASVGLVVSHLRNIRYCRLHHTARTRTAVS